MIYTPFDRCGLASLDDLATPAWKALFSRLESLQSEFLAIRPHCEDYPWPRDPLHNFIRVWEYPYVFHQIQSWLGEVSSNDLPRIVDLGSGATFFPFAVAQLGARVTAIDADSRAISSLDRAIAKLSTGRGVVTSLLSDARSIALETGSVDCVYCISVLEHIPNFEDVVTEVRRILRPGGLFVLTFDVGIHGNCELGPDAYKRLLDVLHTSFAPVYPETVIHPLRVLTNINSIYPIVPDRSIRGHLSSLMQIPRYLYYSMFDSNSTTNYRLKPGSFLAGTYGSSLRKPCS